MAVNVSLTKGTRAHLSRSELLDWVNNLLQTRYQKIEDMCSGVAYCRLMHKIYPDAVQIKRVKCNASFEYEYMENFKLLKKAFDMLKVNRIVPFNDLVKGRFHDNLEFMQWFKKFYDANYIADNERDDSSTARTYTIRSLATKRDIASAELECPQPASGSNKPLKSTNTLAPANDDGAAGDITLKSDKTDVPAKKVKANAIQSIGLHTPRGKTTPNSTHRHSLAPHAIRPTTCQDTRKQQLLSQIKELQQQVDIGRENIQYMEAVNRFYLEKIRNIMGLCMANDEPLLQDYAKRVLYIISRKTSCISLDIEDDDCAVDNFEVNSN